MENNEEILNTLKSCLPYLEDLYHHKINLISQLKDIQNIQDSVITDKANIEKLINKIKEVIE